MKCPKCNSDNVRDQGGGEYKCRSCGVKIKVQSDSGATTVVSEVMDTVSTIVMVDAVSDIVSDAIGGLFD